MIIFVRPPQCAYGILKNTKNDIPNSIRQIVKKHRSYNLFHIIFPLNFPIVHMAVVRF